MMDRTQRYIAEAAIVDQLIYKDICTVCMYENPGLSMAAANLQAVGRLCFDIHVRRHCGDCARELFLSTY